MKIETLNPPGLHGPSGPYSLAYRVEATRLLFLSGMTPSDEHGNVVGAGDFDAQFRQVFRNIDLALAAAGGSFANIVQFTTYLLETDDFERFRQCRLREFPQLFTDERYPPNTLIVAKALYHPQYRLVVQTVAAL